MRTIPAALGLVAVLAVAGCSSSSSGGSPAASTTPTTNSSAPADQAAATAAIKTTWTTFFNSKTKPAVAASLLQNGSHLAAAIRIAAQVAAQQHLTESATVTNVAFTSPTEATVTYNLLSHGSAVLNAATGTAVLVNGQWEVSQTTFCTLVQLGANGKKVPGCM